MQSYLANGACLGILIDPQERTASVYRPQREPSVWRSPKQLSLDPELPGLVLDFESILGS